MGCSLWAGHTSNLGFPCGLVSKEFLARQETWVQSLGQEDPLEKETHSSILAWEIPWREGPGGPQSMGLQRVRHNSATEQQHLEVACYFVLNLNIIKII